jgi:putative ABC transport system permease protein
MNQVNNIAPPKWPLKILRFFVKKEYLEEIEGDMEELFYDNAEQLSLSKAKRIYTWEMLKLLRPVLMRNMTFFQTLTQYDMFRNYFKVSLRGLMKYPLNSSINILGLSIAIGIAIFGYGFARWTYSTDQFHEHKHEVFLTTFFANREGQLQQYGQTPRALGEMLRSDFAHIKKVCRVDDKSVVVKNGDNVFHERVRLVDPEFLEMFTFPLELGTSQSLRDINSIILSEEMAIKYFGDQNPIGQLMLIKFDKDRSKEFKVTGVAKKFPESCTIRFNFLVNIQNARTADPAYDFHDWESVLSATLIQVDDPANIRSIAAGMDKYKKLQNDAAPTDWAIAAFGFEPLATLHERSADIHNDISRSSGDNYKTIYWLVGMTVLMLALACFNYVNIAIVSATKRLKEIGVRKSIGATRKVMIVQFLSENMVITFFALVVGFILGATVFIPWFENQWNFNMGFTLLDKNLLIYLPLVLFITGVASGVYPAFYISKFNVVGILKGTLRFGDRNILTKVLLGVQLVIACIFMTSAIMFSMNNSYLADRSWGYDQHNAMFAVLPDQSSYGELHALLLQDPAVVSVSGSKHHIGKSNASTIIHFPDREYEVDELSVDANYFKTMGIALISGRGFHDHEGSDKQSIVVNELLVRNLGWKEAIGQQFQIDSVQYEVVGVVKDFHPYTFFKPVKPTIFKVADRSEYRYLSMRVRAGEEEKGYQTLKSKWTQLYPEIPFEGGYQEETWGNYYEATAIYGRVWRAFAFMAILLASLGLYGLVTLNVAKRTKEFSIRKILGAGIKSLTLTISKQYIILFAIALTIASPLSYMMIKFTLTSTYTVHVPITFAGVAMAASTLVLVLIVTLASQVAKVHKANPVNGLKVE